jgi:hypothetical protein
MTENPISQAKPARNHSLDWELMVRATLEQHSRRIETAEVRLDALESAKDDRVSVAMHVHNTGHQSRFTSIPPQVRRHGGTALVIAVVTGIIELIRAWAGAQ